ncbi:MAG: hypothetical protein ABIK37_03710 [candidate division WOR-3 bacterium]
MRGLFVVPDEDGVIVLDAAGRRVAKGGLAPGVYFLKQGRAAPRRLVVVR